MKNRLFICHSTIENLSKQKRHLFSENDNKLVWNVLAKHIVTQRSSLIVLLRTTGFVFFYFLTISNFFDLVCFICIPYQHEDSCVVADACIKLLHVEWQCDQRLYIYCLFNSHWGYIISSLWCQKGSSS